MQGIKKIRDKEDKAAILLGRVTADLEMGIDPEYREFALTERKALRAREAIRFEYDRLVNLFMVENNYITPIPKKEGSAMAYKSFFNNQLRNFFISVGKLKDIREICTEDIEQFLDKGKRGELQVTERSGKNIAEGVTNKAWNSTTANVKRGWISALFSIAVRKRMLLINPVSIIPKTKLESKKEARFKIYTRDEIDIMFKYFEEHSQFLESVAKTLYYAYIRESELFRLKLRMINLEQDKITIPADIAKGQRDGFSRDIVIYPKLKECLLRWLDFRFKGDLNQDYYLFPSLKQINKRFDKSNFHDLYNSVMMVIKKDNPTHFRIKSEFYALKHTSVTFFIQDNRNSKSMTSMLVHLQKQLRHEDLSTTQIYISKELGIMIEDEEKFVMR